MHGMSESVTTQIYYKSVAYYRLFGDVTHVAVSLML